MTDAADRSVLVLGGGVHGAAVARELLLNGVPVTLVDLFDVVSGATAKSSRLIHGGLRYLEFGDVKLVRESLTERRRMLELAPYFVRPLRLCIPLEQSWSGLVQSAAGFCGLRRTALGSWFAGRPAPRGYWPVRIGLKLYDWLSSDGTLPLSAPLPLSDPAAPQVDARRYSGLLAYSDAQLWDAERLVLALLADCRALAAQANLEFAVRTYSRAAFVGDAVEIRSTEHPAQVELRRPPLIVNATGAWGDRTLQSLDVQSPPLFGGTRGSHFITWHEPLRTALRGQGVYAEADDARLVFVLPFHDAVLVGTTDEKFTGSPETAIATPEELAYLLDMVHRVFGLRLTRADIAVHYSGVRPLPRAEGPNAAISRDHAITWDVHAGRSIVTLVGGKLTTWRSFAAEVVDQALSRLGGSRRADTHARRVPGNDPLPDGLAPGEDLWRRWALEFGTTTAEVAALWPLFGTRTSEVLSAGSGAARRYIADGPWSVATVRWIIEHEWVARLEDLVERRLLAVFARTLTRPLLADLAQCLVDSGRLPATEADAAVARCCERLQTHYGRTL